MPSNFFVELLFKIFNISTFVSIDRFTFQIGQSFEEYSVYIYQLYMSNFMMTVGNCKEYDFSTQPLLSTAHAIL